MATDINDRLKVKLVDLNSLKEVPDSLAWKPSPSVNTESTIPVIDLCAENVLDLIGDACKNWGIFQVVNHSFKQSLIDEVEEAARRLFSLPMEQKLKARASRLGGPGYGLPGLYNFYPNNLPWMEGFHMVGSPLEHARQLWPTDYQKFCDLFEEYNKELKSLSTRMMWLMLEALGINENNVNWGGPKEDFEDWYSAIQVNAYPPCPNPDAAMGFVPHTDSTILTILQQNTSGLEAHHEEFGWVAIPTIPGSLIINVGDLLHIMSNGLYKSALHRVTLNEKIYRVSAAYFLGTLPTVKIQPLPNLVDHSHPQVFNPITLTEWLGLRRKYNPDNLENLLTKIRVFPPGNELDGNNPDSVQEECQNGDE